MAEAKETEALASVAMRLHLPPARVFALCTAGELSAEKDPRGAWVIDLASVRKYEAKRKREREREYRRSGTRGTRKNG